MHLKNVIQDKRAGFTLVELIVVLVILAILAAILVPTLLGYVKEARERRYFRVAGTVREAAQAVADDQYAHGFDYKYGRASAAESIDVNDRNSQGQLVVDVAGLKYGYGDDKVAGLYFNLDENGQITNGNVEFECDGYWYRYNYDRDKGWTIDDRTWDMAHSHWISDQNKGKSNS